MDFIFDFDRTLFDTAHFVNEAAPYKESGLYITPAIWDILDATTFVYSDVLSFLQKIGKEHSTILTAMTPTLGPLAREFQKAKLERSGVSAYTRQVIFMEGKKGKYVKEIFSGKPTIFVDDTLEQLQSVKAFCPEVVCIQIIRPNSEGRSEVSSSSDIPTVTSLQELETFFI